MYNKREILESILSSSNESIFFVGDMCTEVGISRATFYNLFPAGTKNNKLIMQKISKNRFLTRKGLQKKWFDSNNATLQLALYKLIATDEERKRLSSTYIEIKDNDNIKPKLTLDDVSVIVRSLKDY